jgi:hypothetical protein
MNPEIMALFKKNGYSTQASIARALCEKGYCPQGKERSLTAFINQIFNGKRSCPDKLRTGLIELSDPGLLTLLEYTKPSSLEGRILEKSDKLWNKVLDAQRFQDEEQILNFYIDFRAFARKYVQF